MDINTKKTIRLIMNVFLVISMVPGMYIAWRYKSGLTSKNIAMFWISIIVFFPSLFEFIFSLLTNESVSKGVMISEQQSPNLYVISVIVALITCLLSGFGIFYYYD